MAYSTCEQKDPASRQLLLGRTAGRRSGRPVAESESDGRLERAESNCTQTEAWDGGILNHCSDIVLHRTVIFFFSYLVIIVQILIN
jgi:hypothetical protein